MSSGARTARSSGMTCRRPRGEDFWVAGHEIATGKKTYYHLQRDEWSVHFNVSPDGKLFAGDGGDAEMVAHARDGKWIYLYRPVGIPDVAGIKAPNSEDLVVPGFLAFSDQSGW